jgi:hypothetical protein
MCRDFVRLCDCTRDVVSRIPTEQTADAFHACGDLACCLYVLLYVCSEHVQVLEVCFLQDPSPLLNSPIASLNCSNRLCNVSFSASLSCSYCTLFA